MSIPNTKRRDGVVDIKVQSAGFGRRDFLFLSDAEGRSIPPDLSHDVYYIVKMIKRFRSKHIGGISALSNYAMFHL